jgi:hypothetical protein
MPNEVTVGGRVHVQVGWSCTQFDAPGISPQGLTFRRTNSLTAVGVCQHATPMQKTGGVELVFAMLTKLDA